VRGGRARVQIGPLAALALVWCAGCPIGRYSPNGQPPEAGAECGDLRTDPHNCGTCGHDCGGGACQDGFCGPLAPGILATGLGQPGPIVLDDAAVYWANLSPPAILRCEKTGCGNAPTVLARGYQAAATNLVLHDHAVYWGADSALYVCPTAGCGGAPKRLPVDGLVGQVAVAQNGDVYFVQQFVRSSGVGECPAAGCNGGTQVGWIPASGVPYQADMFAPNAVAIAIDATSLYVLGATLLPGILTTCALDACATTSRSLFISPQGGFRVVALDENNVYLVLSDPPNGAHIELVPKQANPRGGFPMAGADATVALVTGLNEPSAVAVDGISVYYADRGESTDAGVLPSGAGSIGKCPVSGCGGSAQIVQDFVNQPAGIAVDDTSVYWTEQMTTSDPLSGRVVFRPK